MGNNKKKTFKVIIIGFVFILTILPFITTFNSFLTGIAQKSGMYKLIQNYVVPVETKFVLVVVRSFGITSYIDKSGDRASLYLKKGDELLPLKIEWNCLGWQSFLLLAISFLVGLDGNFSKESKLECIGIGILGTFLVNIVRMVIIILGTYYFSSFFGYIIHDYLAAVFTIIWLGIFWWISYKYVLAASTA